jgi:uncharacterized protein with PQ loop repeat
MSLVAITGIVATVVSTGILVPTAISMYIHKTAKGAEPMMVMQALLANALWMAYGGMAGDEYVFVRAFIAGFFSAATLIMYYRYK